MNHPSRSYTPIYILLAVLVLVLLVTPFFGATGFINTLSGWDILWKLRVPRTLLAALAGAGLAAAGCAYQAVFRNPLAEPYTLGVAGGAALGAYIAVVVIAGGAGQTTGSVLPDWLAAAFGQMSMGALIGALAITAIIWLLAGVIRQYGTATLLLAGVAMSYVCSALIMYLQMRTRPEINVTALRWAIGGVDTSWKEGALVGVALWVALGSAVLLARHRVLDLLMMGELMAASRGVAVERERILLGLSAGVMTAGIVAHCGPIAFIGLVVPHVLRRFVGPTHARLLPASLAGGALFLVVCDTLARSAQDWEIPVGVVCNLFGGLFFFAILIWGRKRAF